MELKTFGKLAAGLVGVGIVVGTWYAMSESPLRRTFGSSAEALSGMDSPVSGGRKGIKSFALRGADFEAASGEAAAARPRPAPSPMAALGPDMRAGEARVPSMPPARSEASRQARIPERGQLTAGDWDDNLNFPFFLSYVDRFLSAAPGYPHVTVSDRAVIAVRNAQGRPVAGARVTVSGGGNARFTSTTAADGRVLFVPGLDGFTQVDALSVMVEPPVDQPRVRTVRVAPPTEGREWAIELPQAESRQARALDLAFVLDTTGSMGDELEYLKSEIQGIADAVRRQSGNVELRFGLVLYRDLGDEYVTRTVDFTDLASFRSRLNQQSARGGGDTPEAMEQGLEAMNGLSWRGGDVARVAFLVADAPAHRQNVGRFFAQVNAARERGIRLYSIAASGADDQAEFLLRQAAQLTLARYLFLTDDSGVGNSHAEPHLPCYQVQRLSGLVARMIRSELTGVREEARDIVRSVGNPENGRCRASNGVAYRF